MLGALRVNLQENDKQEAQVGLTHSPIIAEYQ